MHLTPKQKGSMFSKEAVAEMDQLVSVKKGLGKTNAQSIELVQSFLDKWTPPASKFLLPQAIRDVFFGARKRVFKEARSGSAIPAGTAATVRGIREDQAKEAQRQRKLKIQQSIGVK